MKVNAIYHKLALNHSEINPRYYEIKKEKKKKKKKWPKRQQLSHWYLPVQCYQMHVSGSSCAAAITIRSGAVCPQKFMCWFWPSWIKKFSLCMLFLLNKRSLLPVSQSSSSISKPSKPTTLPQYSLLQSCSVLSHPRGWDDTHIKFTRSRLGVTNRVLTYLSFSQTTGYWRQIPFPEL